MARSMPEVVANVQGTTLPELMKVGWRDCGVHDRRVEFMQAAVLN